MFRITFYITFFLIVSVVNTAHAKRLALVIGNDVYDNLNDSEQLERAGNDARAVGRALGRLKFRVFEGYNLKRRAMNEKIAELSDEIQPGDEVVFFFAGHGVGIRGQNYLLPSDIPKTNREGLLKAEAILVSSISNSFKERGAKISLLILDACRNNPMKTKSGRSLGASRGLYGMDAPGSGTMVIFSAGAGEVALDSLTYTQDNSKNSVFTRTLIPLLEQKGLEIHKLARLVRKQTFDLARKDKHRQTPASYDEILNDYYLAGRSVRQPSDQDASDRSRAEFEAMQKRLAALEVQLKRQKEKQKSKGTDVAVGVFPKAKPVKKGRFVHGYKFDDCNGADWCPKMIVVRGGSFVMGSVVSEKGRDDSEGPRRRVTIGKLAVGRFEVSRGQFHSFVNETGHFAGEKCWAPGATGWKNRERHNYLKTGFYQDDDHPAVCINWEDAQAYIIWLRKKTGKHYRLLTEAEWEYVASANNPDPFWWGRSISTRQANYDGSATYANGRTGINRKRTVLIGSFRANPFGLYNVHGNAWEWVQDCWYRDYRFAPKNGSARLDTNGGHCLRHVLRGGSWRDVPRILRTRVRFGLKRYSRDSNIGFRVARTLDN